MTAKFTQAQVTEYADAMEAAGLSYTFGEAAKELLAGVWYDDLCAISGELHRRLVVRKVEAFATTLAIKAYMLSIASAPQRGLQPPHPHDLSHFARTAQRTINQYHKPVTPWAPVGPCGLKMKLKEAVAFGSSQEAYADYSTYLVPVDGDVSKADLSAARANVSSFFKCADTHTGMAGSGCNWTADLLTNEHGAVVIVTCRASIAD